MYTVYCSIVQYEVCHVQYEVGITHMSKYKVCVVCCLVARDDVGGHQARRAAVLPPGSAVCRHVTGRGNHAGHSSLRGAVTQRFVTDWYLPLLSAL
jgi:hypothetical protein